MDISKKIKAAFAFISGAMITIAVGIILLSDEDFQPYVHKVMTLDGKSISGNAFVIEEIEAPLAEIVSGIEPGMTLAYAEYTFYSGDDVKAAFFYTKETDANRNATVCININIDGANQTAAEAIFEEGIRKRVRLTFSRPLTNNKSVDIFGEYMNCVDGITKSGRDNLCDMPITITVTDEKIYRLVYSEDDGVMVNL